MTQIYANNLKVLKTLRPDIARSIESMDIGGYEIPHGIFVEQSKIGKPALKIAGLAANSVYDPVTEGEKLGRQFADSLNNDCKTILSFGIALGYHLQPLVDMRRFDLILYEPSLTVLRATLHEADISGLLSSAKYLYVGGEWGQAVFRLPADTGAIFIHPAMARIYQPVLELVERRYKAHQLATSEKFRITVIPPVEGGSLPTAKSAASALARMGHCVDYVDFSQYAEAFRANALLVKSRQDTATLRSAYTNFLGEVAAAKINEFLPEIIIVLAQGPVTPNTAERFRQYGAPTAFWFVEDFRMLPYWRQVAPHYDHFFSIQRGEFEKLLAEAGAKAIHYLPQAADVTLHQKLRLEPAELTKYGSPVSFMGAGYPNRHKFFSKLDVPGFKIWGTGWNPATSAGMLAENRRLDPAEYVKIFNATKINLNLHSSMTSDGIESGGDFINPRTFEIAACGAFQLVDHRPELEYFFNVGSEIAVFESLADAKDKIRYYLDHNSEREEMAELARRRVIAEHTFEHRMREMLAAIVEADFSRIQDLRSRLAKANPNEMKTALNAARQDPELFSYIKKFDSSHTLSLNEILEDISRNNSPLTDVERIFSIIGSIVTEKRDLE